MSIYISYIQNQVAYYRFLRLKSKINIKINKKNIINI